MPRGRPLAPLTLTDEQRDQLNGIARSATLPHAHYRKMLRQANLLRENARRARPGPSRAAAIAGHTRADSDLKTGADREHGEERERRWVSTRTGHARHGFLTATYAAGRSGQEKLSRPGRVKCVQTPWGSSYPKSGTTSTQPADDNGLKKTILRLSTNKARRPSAIYVMSRILPPRVLGLISIFSTYRTRSPERRTRKIERPRNEAIRRSFLHNGNSRASFTTMPEIPIDGTQVKAGCAKPSCWPISPLSFTALPLYVRP